MTSQGWINNARPGVPLSRRESQAVGQILRGFTYEQAADRLGISINTLKTHLKRSYKKLGIDPQAGKKALLANPPCLCVEDLISLNCPHHGISQGSPNGGA